MKQRRCKAKEIEDYLILNYCELSNGKSNLFILASNHFFFFFNFLFSTPGNRVLLAIFIFRFFIRFVRNYFISVV